MSSLLVSSDLDGEQRSGLRFTAEETAPCKCCHVYMVATIYTWGFGFVTGFIGHFQFVITIYSGAIAYSYSLKFIVARNETSRGVVPSPVLWYGLQTVNYPLTGLPNCLRAAATATLDSVFFFFLLYNCISNQN
jgi:hypothetical protein